MNNVKISLLNFLCALLLIYFMILAWQHVVVSTPFFDCDFKTFYLSLKNDHALYQPHYYYHLQQVVKTKIKTVIHSGPRIDAINMNTPMMNIFMRLWIHPHMSLRTSVLIFMSVSLLCAVFSVYLLCREWVLPFTLLLWLSWPSLYNLYIGQISYLVLPFLCWGLLLYEKEKWNALSVVLGLVAGLKLFFLIFILLFLSHKKWVHALIFICAFVFFFFSPFIYFSWDNFHQFMQLVNQERLFVSRALFPTNGSILGLVMHIDYFLKHHSSLFQIRLATSILCFYVLLRWFIYDYRHLHTLSAFNRPLRFSFLILLSLLCSPLGWAYYFIFLIIPVVVMLRIAKQFHFSVWFFIFFSASIGLLYFGWMKQDGIALDGLQMVSVFLSLVSFFIALCFSVRAVRLNQPAVITQSYSIIAILMLSTIIAVSLLLFNYGMPYFLDPTQQAYLNHVNPIIQVRP